MKKFFTFIPRQDPQNLVSGHYEVVEKPEGQPETDCKLYYPATSFPILPVLNGFTEPGDQVRLIALDEHYDNSGYNFPKLKEEVAVLEQEKKIDVETKDICVPFDDSMKAHLTVFQKLIEEIEDDDELYACITYGSKPSPIIMLLAFQYAKKIKRRTDIKCIVYGQMNHRTHEGKIFDLTNLMRLDDLLDTLAEARVRNVKALLSKILDISDDGGDCDEC